MGNRTKKSTTYTTYTGETIDSTNYSSNFMETLNDHIDKWLSGDYNTESIISHMSFEEVEYLLDHLESTEGHPGVFTGHLTRLEMAEHFELLDLKKGDVISGSNLFRSFSQDPQSTQEIYEYYVENSFGSPPDFVIYRTVGNVPFFNPQPFSNPYPEQSEVFVPLDTMRVENVQKFTSGDSEKLSGVIEADMNIPDDCYITVVDVSYDKNVKSVPISIFDDGRETEISVETNI